MGRIEILWVEDEAEAIECRCDDVERRHWKKAEGAREVGAGING